jgi:hypothetical protein
MERTQYLLFLAILLLAGCDSTSNAPSPGDVEPSFAEQVAGVRDGKSDRIQAEAAALADDDLAGLAGLTTLRELLIDHPQSRVTAGGIKQLRNLPALEHLRIRGPGIDDPALGEIARIGTLQILNIPQADLTDAGLAPLKELPNLVQLRFGSPRVTDAGMKTLAGLPALKRLHLIDVPITDQGLAVLAKIERLESLYVDGGTISDEAWENLFRERPKLHVHVNQEHHDRDPHRHPH